MSRKKKAKGIQVGSYITSSIIPGEDLHAVGAIHGAFMIKPVLFALVGFLFLLFIRSALGAGGLLFFMLFLVCIAPILAAAIYVRTTESAITSKRVLFKTGAISRNADEISVKKIETVTIRQGIIGRLLGYGTIVVRGTGGQALSIRGIANPMYFREVLQQVIAVN